MIDQIRFLNSAAGAGRQWQKFLYEGTIFWIGRCTLVPSGQVLGIKANSYFFTIQASLIYLSTLLRPSPPIALFFTCPIPKSLFDLSAAM